MGKRSGRCAKILGYFDTPKHSNNVNDNVIDDPSTTGWNDMTTYIEDTWNRIEEANLAAGWPNDWTLAERDQIEALAEDLNKELLAAPATRSWVAGGSADRCYPTLVSCAVVASGRTVVIGGCKAHETSAKARSVIGAISVPTPVPTIKCEAIADA